MARGILRFIDRLGKGPLRRILLTHGHMDHVGAIPSILASRDVPVFAHPIELPYMEGDRAYPRRSKAVEQLRKGTARALEVSAFNPLPNVGRLTPYHTPGHSPGHVVYFDAEERILLGGDLLTSRAGRIRPPMKSFTGDMEEALQSATILSELEPKILEVCHGDPVLNPASQLGELGLPRAAKRTAVR